MTAATTYAPIEARFWPKVDRRGPDECWLWIGFKSWDGYGRLRPAGRGGPVGAHRIAYELAIGPIPEGLTIDHLCGVTSCVNPAHLEPVTAGENVRRSPFTLPSINAAKTQCIHGHPFDAANTHIKRNGRRVCRTCNRERARRNRQRSAA